MKRASHFFNEVLPFLTQVSWATLLVACAGEGFLPGLVTTQISLAFFLWIAILLTVAKHVSRYVQLRAHTNSLDS